MHMFIFIAISQHTFTRLINSVTKNETSSTVCSCRGSNVRRSGSQFPGDICVSLRHKQKQHSSPPPARSRLSLLVVPLITDAEIKSNLHYANVNFHLEYTKQFDNVRNCFLKHHLGAKWESCRHLLASVVGSLIPDACYIDICLLVELHLSWETEK